MTGDLATLDAINMADVRIETVQLHLPTPSEPTLPPEVPYKQTPGPEPPSMPLITSRPEPAPMLLLLVPIFIIAGMVLLLILLRWR